ncbi:unnamed protein product [Prorocentrum cordatum]|uniref:Carrier domain-containing protein n=1 Tax=Prorocentrum cordatum TaxID=2364126 RepID=A0ABN9QP70_9DINO|nr:unnamed protein product [Polarella glacialis]
MLITAHHSVIDGRSLAILAQEISMVYTGLVLKHEVQLPPLALQYADFSYWQRQWMAQGRMDEQLKYWRRQLEGLQVLQLPGDWPRPARLPPDGAQVRFQLPAEVAAGARALARARGSTLFGVLLAAFGVVLGRWGNSPDVAVASVVANRDAPEVERLVGYFVNTVVFRMQLQGSFEQLLAQLRDKAAGAFANASAPYVSVLDSAGIDPAAVPAMFVLQDAADNKWSMPGVSVAEVELPRTAALFDITLEMREDRDGGGSLSGFVVYNTSLWTEGRAKRFVDSLQAVLAAAAAEPTAALGALPAIQEADSAQILTWGGHNEKAERSLGPVEALGRRLLMHAGRDAILHGAIAVTFEEFGLRVAALASEVKRRLGDAAAEGEEAVVAVLLPRSVEMAVAVWAVLGAGAAYVPVDPEYPAERIAHIFENAAPRLLLCWKDAATSAPLGSEAFCVEEWPARDPRPLKEAAASLERPAPERLAYVIYTSGSTGRPKGVAVEHKAVANMVKEQIRLMGIAPEDRVLQFFKPAFDGAVQEYLSTPCAGAALVLWDADQSFADVLLEKRVSVATLTPSALAVLDPHRLPHLKSLAVAAEAAPPSLVDAWAQEGRRLVNAYGPSESCVVVTCAELHHGMKQVPIGRPLQGCQCYVLEPSERRSLQPVGVGGELCIGGVQLARGYYGSAAKTAEKFAENPVGGARMYRSGDMATWLPEGQLLYLGRNDDMVKVRGFRVELTEVEAALAACGAQFQAAALNSTKDGLWAWATPASLDAARLREGVQKILPQYMVPQRIFVLEELPLNPNGKIDKVKLLSLAAAATTVEDEQSDDGPQSHLEERLCTIISSVLGVERVGVTANLKDCGMSSLKSVLLVSKLRDAGFSVPLGQLYELTTVKAIAEFVEAEQGAGDLSMQVAESSSRRTCCSRRGIGNSSAATFWGLVWFALRLVVWMWISGVVIWPAVLPLWFASSVALPHLGLAWALLWLVVAAYPMYLLGVASLCVLTKWAVVGRYKTAAVPTDSWAFLRWWAVDRLLAYAGELALGALRGSPMYFAYLRAMGLQARGYCRVDTRFVSEFDLISLGNGCVIAEGAKLRPGVLEAGLLRLKPMCFGDRCAISENAVCTSGATAGSDVTLQPLSFLSGRTGRTLPDGSVWKGCPLGESRQQPIRQEEGRLWKDLASDLLALLTALALLVASAGVAYCVFQALAVAQGMPWDSMSDFEKAQGALFAAAWLLFGPPVMVSADVLMGLDLANAADRAATAMGEPRWQFGLRVAGMIVLAYAAHGWTLTFCSALLGRVLRGSRRKRGAFFQARTLFLRITFPRYPAQLSGTAAMALYLRLLGGRVSPTACVSLSEPPLEPRKLRVGARALVINAQALGEASVGDRAFVGGGSVLLPHAEVERGAVVGGMSVVGRPVKTGTVLAGNPGVIVRRAELARPPPCGLVPRLVQELLWVVYPLLAPMLLQLVLLVTLLPAMYALTVVMDTLESDAWAWARLPVVCMALAPAYVLLGWCLALVAVVLKWVVVGKVRPQSGWQWHGSAHHYAFAFVQSLCGLTTGVYAGMAHGSPLYNWWLRLLGSHVATDAVVMTPIMDFDVVSIGSGAVVEREATVSATRMLPAQGGPSEFCTRYSTVSVGPRSTISCSAAMVAADTGELSVLAPLSTLGPSARLPARALAVGSPPQKFVWSKERDNLIRPSTRPLPGELKPSVPLPPFVARALGRMKVQSSTAPPDAPAPLVTGANGFLGRFIVAALLETTECQVLCLVRGADSETARGRLEASLRTAGVTSPELLRRVEVVKGDLSKRSFGLPFAEFQRLAGRASHVINTAARVNLAEPFQLMRKDNVEAVAHLLEFCCVVRCSMDVPSCKRGDSPISFYNSYDFDSYPVWACATDNVRKLQLKTGLHRRNGSELCTVASARGHFTPQEELDFKYWNTATLDSIFHTFEKRTLAKLDEKFLAGFGLLSVSNAKQLPTMFATSVKPVMDSLQSQVAKEIINIRSELGAAYDSHILTLDIREIADGVLAAAADAWRAADEAHGRLHATRRAGDEARLVVELVHAAAADVHLSVAETRTHPIELKTQVTQLGLRVNNLYKELLDTVDQRLKLIELDTEEMQQQIDSIEQHVQSLQSHEQYPVNRDGSPHVDNYFDTLLTHVQRDDCCNGFMKILNSLPEPHSSDWHSSDCQPPASGIRGTAATDSPKPLMQSETTALPMPFKTLTTPLPTASTELKLDEAADAEATQSETDELPPPSETYELQQQIAYELEPDEIEFNSELEHAEPTNVPDSIDLCMPHPGLKAAQSEFDELLMPSETNELQQQIAYELAHDELELDELQQPPAYDELDEFDEHALQSEFGQLFSPSEIDELRLHFESDERPLGDIRSLPLYGTGDQANGYPYSKWLAELLVFKAGRQGLPVSVHRPGLIGGHSQLGVMAKARKLGTAGASDIGMAGALAEKHRQRARDGAAEDDARPIRSASRLNGPASVMGEAMDATPAGDLPRAADPRGQRFKSCEAKMPAGHLHAWGEKVSEIEDRSKKGGKGAGQGVRSLAGQNDPHEVRHPPGRAPVVELPLFRRRAAEPSGKRSLKVKEKDRGAGTCEKGLRCRAGESIFQRTSLLEPGELTFRRVAGWPGEALRSLHSEKRSIAKMGARALRLALRSSTRLGQMARQTFTAARRAVEITARRRGAPPLPLPSDGDYIRALFQYFSDPTRSMEIYGGDNRRDFRRKVGASAQVCLQVIDSIRETLARLAPTWTGFRIQDQAKYFGTFIGPGATLALIWVDWVAKAIVAIAMAPGGSDAPAGSTFHPAAPGNAVTMGVLAAVLREPAARAEGQGKGRKAMLSRSSSRNTPVILTVAARYKHAPSPFIVKIRHFCPSVPSHTVAQMPNTHGWMESLHFPSSLCLSGCRVFGMSLGCVSCLVETAPVPISFTSTKPPLTSRTKYSRRSPPAWWNFGSLVFDAYSMLRQTIPSPDTSASAPLALAFRCRLRTRPSVSGVGWFPLAGQLVEGQHRRCQTVPVATVLQVKDTVVHFDQPVGLWSWSRAKRSMMDCTSLRLILSTSRSHANALLLAKSIAGRRQHDPGITFERDRPLQEAGYEGLRTVDFSQWRDSILADPEQFKSWSFCAALSVEGDGIDSMVEGKEGAKAMRAAVGAEAFDSFSPRACLERSLEYCIANGLLPPPDAASSSCCTSTAVGSRPLARPLLGEP